jgi:peptidoglycan/LPS O-acetylase OafA/YrhL
MAKKEIGGLDLIRFYAALMVAVFHLGFWAWAYPTGMGGSAAGAIAPMPALSVIGQVGFVGVEVFFVISGFVIAFSASTAGAWDFARRRVLRLAPAVWLIAPLTALIAVAFAGADGVTTAKQLVKTVFFHPFGGWVDSVYWTLGIEIAFYGLVWLMIWAGLRSRIETLAYVLGGIGTVFWMTHAFVQPLHFESFETRLLQLALVHHGPLFAIGMLLWRQWSESRVTKGRVLAILVFCVAAAIQISDRAYIDAEKTGIDPAGGLAVLAWLVALAGIVASLLVNLRWHGFRTIGLMTYPLYLLHNVVGGALMGGLYRAGVPIYTAMLLALLATIALSWIVAVRWEPVVRQWLQRAIETGLRSFQTAKAALLRAPS